MAGLKESFIKWLGGFTETEVTEKVKEAETMTKEPYVVYKQPNTVELFCEQRFPAWENVPEEYLRRILAEGLAKEIEKHMRITYSTDQMTDTYRTVGQIEVVVREGDQ